MLDHSLNFVPSQVAMESDGTMTWMSAWLILFGQCHGYFRSMTATSLSDSLLRPNGGARTVTHIMPGSDSKVKN